MASQQLILDRYALAHRDPQGPGDARPTALQIVRDNELENTLASKVMLVTGASTGIGVDTATALAATGAKIFLGVRNLDKGAQVVQSIEAAVPVSKGRLELIRMDLSSLESTRSAAQSITNKTDCLNVVVNNAGSALAPKSTTTDGFDGMFQVNYLSHFLLFQLLKPLLLKSSMPTFRSRVVNVSSLIHRQCTIDFEDMNWTKRDYSPFQAYASSKTAMIWMTNEIERRFGAQGIHGYSLMPGTNLGTNGASSFAPEAAAIMDSIIGDAEVQKQAKSNEQGAATTVLAAIDKELEGKGGVYLENCGISKPWDEAIHAETDPGYASWCYDEAGAKRLWEVACKYVGVDE